MKLAVIGSGSVGSIISGVLAQNGYDVTLVVRKKSNQILTEKELSIKNKQTYITVTIPMVTTLDFVPDMVFFAVKTQDLENAIIINKNQLMTSKIVLLQNGLNTTEIAANHFERKNITRCIVLFNAKKNTLGDIEINGKQNLLIGSAYKSDYTNVYQLRDILSKSFTVKVTKNILAGERTKLLMNIFSNSIQSIFGRSLPECVNNEEILTFGIMILKEAYYTMQKSKLKTISIPGMPITLLRFFMAAPLPITRYAFKQLFNDKAYYEVTTSTLQSLQKGKSTEIDYLNGEIVKLGVCNTIHTPFNEVAIKAIHNVEKTGVFLTMDDINEYLRAKEDFT